MTTEYENFKMAPITTTRERRESEGSDRKYYFIAKEEFEKILQKINSSNMYYMPEIIMERAKNLCFLC